MQVPGAEGPSILVIGSVNADLVARVERLPRPGETIHGHDFQQHLGGKGANQAVTARLLGSRAALLGRVGDDGAGREALAALDRAGVDRRRVGVAAGEPTGVALITVGSRGENTIVVIAGANGGVDRAQVEAAQEAVFGCDTVLLQFEVPDEAVLAAARLVARRRAAGAPGPALVVNPSPFRASAMPPLDQMDGLIVNEVEAEQVSGHPVTDPESAARVAMELLPALRPGGWVVVTLGALGAVGVRELAAEPGSPAEGGRARSVEGPLHVAAFDVDAVDTTGAGDVFTGGFLTELGRGRPLGEALRFATAASAICVTRHGAQSSFPRRDEVERLLPEAPPAVPVGS